MRDNILGGSNEEDDDNENDCEQAIYDLEAAKRRRLVLNKLWRSSMTYQSPRQLKKEVDAVRADLGEQMIKHLKEDCWWNALK
jgi:hypothetical protein